MPTKGKLKPNSEIQEADTTPSKTGPATPLPPPNREATAPMAPFKKRRQARATALTSETTKLVANWEARNEVAAWEPRDRQSIKALEAKDTTLGLDPGCEQHLGGTVFECVQFYEVLRLAVEQERRMKAA